MDLDQIIDSVVPPSARGKRAAEVKATVRRELNESDIAALWALPAGGLGATTPSLKKIRFQHHSLARLMAEGRSQADCALITGYSPTYISNIKSDPAMQELIEHYKTQVDEIFLNVHERLLALGLNTIEELQDRLAEEPENFSLRELMELASLTFDRSGYGPSSKINHSITHSISPDTISRIKGEHAARSQGTVRSIDPQSYTRTEVGGVVIDGSLGEAPEIKRIESQGNNLPERSLPEAGEGVS